MEAGSQNKAVYPGRLLSTLEIGKMLFPVEQLPDGAIPIFTPKRCLRVYNEMRKENGK